MVQGRFRQLVTQVLLRGDVIVDIDSHHGDGVGGKDVQEHFGAETPAVVLAYTQTGAAWKEMVKFCLVLYEPLRSGKSLQRPGHLAGHPQGGISPGYSQLRLPGAQTDNHVRVED